MSSLDALLTAADAEPFEGWDFSFLRGRVEPDEPSWDFAALARARMTAPVLDMGTGGGELFASLAPFPGVALATEAWPPNVPVAARRLRPIGVHVVQVEPAPENSAWRGVGGALPFADGSFGLVLNRHDAYSPTEVFRVLRPGGTFLTQQVGEEDDRELRKLFGSYAAATDSAATLEAQLRDAGFEILAAREEFPRKAFFDVGAVAWYMKVISWQFPHFSIAGSGAFLARIHAMIQASGELVVHDHRHLLEAIKPR